MGSSVVSHGDPIKMMIGCVDKGKARWWRVFFLKWVFFEDYGKPLSSFKGFLVLLVVQYNNNRKLKGYC